MPATSALRQNIYRLLDQVLETGQPIEILRKGRILQIVSKKSINKIQNLKKRSVIKGDPESIIHIDWFETWKP
jgi:hypothetical protein